VQVREHTQCTDAAPKQSFYDHYRPNVESLLASTPHQRTGGFCWSSFTACMPLLTAPSTFRLGEHARVHLSSFIYTTAITLDALSWYYLTTQYQNANKVLFSFAVGTCIARGMLGLPVSNDKILQASKIALSLKDQQISNRHENRDRDQLYDIRCILHAHVDYPQSSLSNR